MNMDQVTGLTEQVTQTAKGISEYGMSAMAAAFFLIISAAMMWGMFILFKRMINGIMSDNNKIQQELIKAINEQSSQLMDVADGLRDKTLNEIKIISGSLFDLGKAEISRIIKTIRSENHIQDKKATIAKIRKMVINIHENRNSKFDTFKYRGRALSSYTSPKWIEDLVSVVEQEIYSEGVNNGRAETNITNVTESMKLDFYHNLNGGSSNG